MELILFVLQTLVIAFLGLIYISTFILLGTLTVDLIFHVFRLEHISNGLTVKILYGMINTLEEL